MNATLDINISELANDLFILGRPVCQKLYVTYNYNLFIIVNFLFSIVFFYLEKKQIKYNRLVFLSIPAIFNTCMLLFQFLVYPLNIQLGG